MDLKRVTDRFYVSSQVDAGEVAGLAGRFRRLVNNRPDGEEPGQPTSDEIKAAAERAGLSYLHIPVVPGQIGQQDIEAFGDAIDSADGPVLAYCRTGTRSASLWALSQASELGADAVLEATHRAGYNLCGLAERL